MIPGINGLYEKGAGYYNLPDNFTVENISFEPWCMTAFCQRTGTACAAVETDGNIRMIRTDDLAGEAYRLQVNDRGIEINASDETGVIWALTTIHSKMENQNIPYCTIEDAPRYAHRGVMLDCVRHFFPVNEVKRVIEELSLVKLNVFHWHLANDQGFRIESRKFPKLHRQCGSDYYTQEQIREIVEFARIRGVEIIPEISMPGHTTAILAACPELSCQGKPVALAQGGGVYPIVLCPGREEVYDFLKELLDEVCPLFPSSRFHIGGDEAPDWEWQTCPHCQAKMKGLGLTNTRQLQGYFFNRVKEILRPHHKDIICFNDSLEASNLAWENDGQKTTVQYWSIQYANSTQAYLEKGGRMIYSDMFEIYLDYPSAMSSMKKVYHCKPAIRDQEYLEAEGLEACLWTEYVSTDKQLERRLFPRVYALAENAWCKKKDYKDFLQRLSTHLEGAAARGIICETLEEADPQGEAKKRGIQEYTTVMQTGMSPEMRELAVKFTQPNEEFQARFMQQFFGMG